MSVTVTVLAIVSLVFIFTFACIFSNCTLSERNDSLMHIRKRSYEFEFAYSPTDVTSYEREVCTRYTLALCSPSRLSLRAALVRRGFITKDTSVCKLICAAIGATYSTTNKGEVRALQWTKKLVGLRLSVLTKSSNKQKYTYLSGSPAGTPVLLAER